MPHKRAKRSVREKNRNESGNDLVPGARKSIENEEIPKSVARVLNAAKVQQEWAEKKRKAQVDDGAGPSRKKRRRDDADGEGGGGSGKPQLRIQPGESMAHFNRRVEDSMRHSVREAMQSSSAKMRKTRKEELSQKNPAKSPANSQTKPSARSDNPSDSEDDNDSAPARRATKKDERPREFEKLSSSAPKRLNDIVQAPPQLKKLPRKAKKLAAQASAQKSEGAKSLRDGVLSMAQKAMMEEERERAIRMYREMKRGKPQT
ncbi:hypothetical protein C8Q78DRAFT_1075058 [Trametes maxima]|nr:hypothetical protein C8Q78DRAFT_1075058 [Trametes maxima]